MNRFLPHLVLPFSVVVVPDWLLSRNDRHRDTESSMDRLLDCACLLAVAGDCCDDT